jgi:hypothetical protein
MKPFRFHAEAESEMIEAAWWYEARQTDLGKRFLTSVRDALNRIEINPLKKGCLPWVTHMRKYNWRILADPN